MKLAVFMKQGSDGKLRGFNGLTFLTPGTEPATDAESDALAVSLTGDASAMGRVVSEAEASRASALPRDQVALDPANPGAILDEGPSAATKLEARLRTFAPAESRSGVALALLVRIVKKLAAGTTPTAGEVRALNKAAATFGKLPAPKDSDF